MIEKINHLTRKYVKIWDQIPSDLNCIKKYSINEQYIEEKFLLNIKYNFFKFNIRKKNNLLYRYKINKIKTNVLNRFDSPYLKLRYIDKIIKKYVKYANTHSDLLSTKDIIQGSRNALVMLFNQILLDCNLSLTNSICAYSLLYSYTDNYLDSPLVTKNEKYNFVNNLNNLILTGNYKIIHAHEERIYKLIKMIEYDFDRILYPNVYNSLYTISYFQYKAIGLAQFDNNLINYSFNKGSASLIAGGYLLGISIDDDKFEFLFLYGFILQLIDDFQDIDDDLKNGDFTFLNSNIYNNIETIIKKIINLIYKFNDFNFIDKSVKSFLINALTLFIIESIINNFYLFTKEFLKEIDLISPISIIFILNEKNNFDKIFL